MTLRPMASSRGRTGLVEAGAPALVGERVRCPVGLPHGVQLQGRGLAAVAVEVAALLRRHERA
jgi:hypothetical protein